MPTPVELGEMAADGCLVKPLFHQFMMDPSAGDVINIMVERPAPRPFDGWFHASQHPGASARDLYRWMTEQSEPEDFSYQARCAVMFGSMFHGMFEAFLDWTGFAVPLPPGDCDACGLPRRAVRARPDPRKYCTEHGFRHDPTRARCHLDAIMSFGSTPAARDVTQGGLRGFDLKTCHPYALRGVKDMDEAAFRAKWPGYWSQGQECMRISGLRRYIFMFVTMGSPWDTREFHFDFDPAYAAATEEKYRKVLYHVENKVPILL